jgi:hypothetical protein
MTDLAGVPCPAIPQKADLVVFRDHMQAKTVRFGPGENGQLGVPTRQSPGS